jgi:hypothetical protein
LRINSITRRLFRGHGIFSVSTDGGEHDNGADFPIAGGKNPVKKKGYSGAEKRKGAHLLERLGKFS